VPVLKGLFFVVLIASGRAMAADSLVMPVQASPLSLTGRSIRHLFVRINVRPCVLPYILY
jgi:hypothetical protein